jgi:hypothetical protein
MKKIAFFLLAFSTFAVFDAHAKNHVKALSKHRGIQDCTQTVTVTRSAQVTCPDGTIVTVSATNTDTETGSDCTAATVSAEAVAGTKASQTVNKAVQYKTYFCP